MLTMCGVQQVKDIVLAVGTTGEDDEARPAQVSAEMLGIINMQNI